MATVASSSFYTRLVFFYYSKVMRFSVFKINVKMYIISDILKHLRLLFMSQEVVKLEIVEQNIYSFKLKRMYPHILHKCIYFNTHANIQILACHYVVNGVLFISFMSVWLTNL